MPWTTIQNIFGGKNERKLFGMDDLQNVVELKNVSDLDFFQSEGQLWELHFCVKIGMMISVTRKNCQMSIKVAQKRFHLKNDRFWHLYKNCSRMLEIWPNCQNPINRPIWSHCQGCTVNTNQSNCLRPQPITLLKTIFSGSGWTSCSCFDWNSSFLCCESTPRDSCLKVAHEGHSNLF